MGLIKLRFTRRANGKVGAWFKGEKGRVRTSAGAVNWLRAGHMKVIGEYAISLQLGQAAKGLGSDGSPMPPLKPQVYMAFVKRVDGKAVYEQRTRYPYQKLKQKLGIEPIRNLRGPGYGGHMLDAIRINYLDDKKVTYSITTKKMRDKARGNEKRARWWGLSPASMRLLGVRAGEVFGLAFEDELVARGLKSSSSVTARRLLGMAA